MIWNFQRALTRRLYAWSAISMAVGIVLLLAGDAFWRGFGLQAVAWGVIDAAIAWFGSASTRKRRSPSPGGIDAARIEARKLRKLLWINTGLDVLYVAGGLILVATLGAQDPFAAGNGWGIVAQGGFLFVFDLLHACATPTGDALPPL
jgi:hypothetical protein